MCFVYYSVCYLSQSIFFKFVGIDIRVYRDGKLLTPSQVEKDYQDWILQMHTQYDEEVDHGEDQPVIVVSPSTKRGKALNMSSDGRDKFLDLSYLS